MHSWIYGFAQPGYCLLRGCKAPSRGSLHATSFVGPLEEAAVLFPEKHPPKEGFLLDFAEMWALKAGEEVCLSGDCI